MRYDGCYCPKYDDGMRLFAHALNDVLTEHYMIFYKHEKVWFWNHIDKQNVRVPKHYEEEYNKKVIEYMKLCISLIDQGYEHGIKPEIEEKYRSRIAEYQMNKNEVWE